MSVVNNVSPLAYSVTEAAEAIRVSPNLIRRMIREGALASARVGNRVLVRREDLARLLESKQ
jgi:excisionase family DNA binding protein